MWELRIYSKVIDWVFNWAGGKDYGNSVDSVTEGMCWYI